MRNRVSRNAFAMDRDVNADAPLDDDITLPPLDNLPPLAPGPQVPAAPPTPATPAGTPGDQDATGQGRGAGRPRGVGGRPPGTKSKDAKESRDSSGSSSAEPKREQRSEPRPETKQDAKPDSRIVRVPARVPADLYDRALPLVKGIGRPSWGQLVAWTCQDHKTQVVAAIVAATTVEGRRPRGQGVVGTAGLQVTCRLFPDERPPVDAVLKDAQAKVKTKVTRTMVVLAALEVATTTTPTAGHDTAPDTPHDAVADSA